MRECHSCAARINQADFPPRKRKGALFLCNDCRQTPPREAGPSRKPITRARYRAAHRVRSLTWWT
jgi:hypothetical protein